MTLVSTYLRFCYALYAFIQYHIVSFILYFTHIVALYISLCYYIIFTICNLYFTVVKFVHFVDDKYDQCILYFLRRVGFANLITYWLSADVNKLAVYCAAVLTLLFTVCNVLNKSASVMNILRIYEPYVL